MPVSGFKVTAKNRTEKILYHSEESVSQFSTILNDEIFNDSYSKTFILKKKPNSALYHCPEILDIAIRHETELNGMFTGKNCSYLLGI